MSGVSPLAVLSERPPGISEFCGSLSKVVRVLEPGELVVAEVVVAPLGEVPDAVVTGAPGSVVCDEEGATAFNTPLPKETFWACKVPDQSTPLDVLGLLDSSTSLVSISTSRSALSS